MLNCFNRKSSNPLEILGKNGRFTEKVRTRFLKKVFWLHINDINGFMGNKKREKHFKSISSAD